MRGRLLIVAGLCASLAPVAAAQDVFERVEAAPAADGAVDPAARALLEESRGKLKDIRDLSCTAAHTTTTGGKTETSTADVVLTYKRVGEHGAGMLQSFRIALGGAQGRVWGFDGETVAMIDHEKKEFAEARPSGSVFPVAAARAALPSWAERDALMSKTATLAGAKLLPDSKVDGVTCRVIEYTVEQPMANPLRDPGDPEPEDDADRTVMVLRQVRHIGADDLLVRKIESWTTYTGGGGEPRSFVGLYTNVKANTDPEPGVFALQQPPGYTVADAEEADLGIAGRQAKLAFAEGDRAPDFALKDDAGTEVTLAGLKGRIVLLDFWATWCGPCKIAMPKVQRLHEKYAGRPVSIFGVNCWERAAPDMPRRYMDKHKYTYGLLMKGDDLAKAYGITGIPTFILIGPDGTILHIGVGFSKENEEQIERKIDEALAKA